MRNALVRQDCAKSAGTGPNFPRRGALPTGMISGSRSWSIPRLLFWSASAEVVLRHRQCSRNPGPRLDTTHERLGPTRQRAHRFGVEDTSDIWMVHQSQGLALGLEAG